MKHGSGSGSTACRLWIGVGRRGRGGVSVVQTAVQCPVTTTLIWDSCSKKQIE